MSLVLILLASSCMQEKGLDAPAAEDTRTLLERKSVNTPDNAVEGTLVVLLSAEAAASLEQGTVPEALKEACDLHGASITRAFPFKGTDLERKHRLDRWYLLAFDAGTAPAAVAETFADLAQIEAVEYSIKVSRMEEDGATEWAPGEHTTSPVLPFNDPKLIDQWHYINHGDLSIAPTVRAGADINVGEAWKLTTGDPAIIVAVCDEAVKYDHPDLAANMWVNEAEKNGEEGVDDDGNGYVDDVHGYNFLSTYNAQTGEGQLMPLSWDRRTR